MYLSLVSIDDLSLDQINEIMTLAQEYEIVMNNVSANNNILCRSGTENKIFCLMFFEPSTRTNLSFQTAICKLNSKFIIYDDNNSSSKKGESIYDTIKTLESYCDGIIIRHPDQEFVRSCSKLTHLPIINAGNGNGEHPTQALLDLYTIQKYNSTSNFSIAFTGDLKNSRTVHSLVKLLDKVYNNITLYFVSCVDLMLTSEHKKNVKNCYYEVKNIDDIISKIDVLYMTRMQKEREDIDTSYNININEDILNKSKSNLILLHPLPRNKEIPIYLDTNKKSKYFEQVKNGVYVRMSILKLLSSRL